MSLRTHNQTPYGQNYLFKFVTFYMHILHFIASHGTYSNMLTYIVKVVKFYSLFLLKMMRTWSHRTLCKTYYMDAEQSGLEIRMSFFFLFFSHGSRKL